VLGTIGQGEGYEQLLADVVDKDLAVLAILRRTLEESTK
jgi:hypothetical protein